MWILPFILVTTGRGCPQVPLVPVAGVGVGFGAGVGVAVGAGVGFGVGAGVAPGIAGIATVRMPLLPAFVVLVGCVGSSSVMVWQPTRSSAAAVRPYVALFMTAPS